MEYINKKLKYLNRHDNDEFISFDPKYHKYTISKDLKSYYTSVTTSVKGLFKPFDENSIIPSLIKKEGSIYYGMTKEEVKDKWKQNAALGTELHEHIETFLNLEPHGCQGVKDVSHEILLDFYNYLVNNGKYPINNSSPEWHYFINFVNDTKEFIPYRTEWSIFDLNLKLSGSIDMVYKIPMKYKRNYVSEYNKKQISSTVCEFKLEESDSESESDSGIVIEDLDDDETDETDETKEYYYAIYDWKRAEKISAESDFYHKYSIHPKLSNKIPDTNFWHYAMQLNIYKYILERNYNIRIDELCLVKLHPNNVSNNYELIDIPDLQKEVELIFA